jgi:hypothetical protein
LDTFLDEVVSDAEFCFLDDKRGFKEEFEATEKIEGVDCFLGGGDIVIL